MVLLTIGNRNPAGERLQNIFRVHIFHEIDETWDTNPATGETVDWKLLAPRHKLRAIAFDDRTINVYGGNHGDGTNL